ncbi:hypothetical protein NZK35_25140 [Stieleria sp. ICT_E10.1]|uniref:hypothetical protein n=1 Tax=Stieleria sedimenti TaxID=2976331 RepID=UPI00217F34F0|nr:hypothetical protein [Stieleria sedimenti]MCS7469952.1 hypothetical protein [Stieleria sedimenti]
MKRYRDLMHALLLTFAATLGFVLAGCENKETLLEVETPDGEIEVQRDRKTGDVNVARGRLATNRLAVNRRAVANTVLPRHLSEFFRIGP